MTVEEAAAEEAAIAAAVKDGGADEKTEKADEAFGESGTQMLDAGTLDALQALDDEPEMKKAEYRLGKDMPDRTKKAMSIANLRVRTVMKAGMMTAPL